MNKWIFVKSYRDFSLSLLKARFHSCNEIKLTLHMYLCILCSQMAKIVCNITIITSSHISCAYFTLFEVNLPHFWWFWWIWTVFRVTLSQGSSRSWSFLNWNWTYSQCIHIHISCAKLTNIFYWPFEVNLLLFRWLIFWMFHLFF